MSRLLQTFLHIAVCGSVALLSYACTPKKISSSYSDDRLYPDDSEINMRAKEKKIKMPFDTGAAPTLPRRK